MVLHHEDSIAFAPFVEHGAVYYVGKTPLRVISNRFPEDVWRITSTKEVSFASCETNQDATSSESRIDMPLPELVSWEGGKVLRLEVFDDSDGEVGLLGEGLWLASIVRAVSKLLAHETVSVVTIVWGFGNAFISLEITSPREVGPANSSNCCVRIARFAGFEILSIMK